MNKVRIYFRFLLFLPLSLMADKSELYLAVNAQDLEQVKVELIKGADVNKKEEDRFTPLSLAVGFKSKEIVVLLESAVTDQTIDGISRYYMDPKVFPNLSPSVFWAKDEKGEMVYLNVAIKRSGKVCSMCNKNLIRCVRGK